MRAATVLEPVETPAATTGAALLDGATMSSAVASQGHAAYSLVFVARAAVVAASTFVCAAAGILAQELLTAPALAGSRSMTGSVVGLVGALLSVVVGLLVWQSYGLFIGQQSDLDALGRALARMRYVLGSFGGEAASARDPAQTDPAGQGAIVARPRKRSAEHRLRSCASGRARDARCSG